MEFCQVVSNDPILHTTRLSIKEKRLVYPLCFCSHTHSLLLYTGANQTMISKKFVEAHQLSTQQSSLQNLQLANSCSFPITLRAIPFQVKLWDVFIMLKGPVMDGMYYNLIPGMDWARHNWSYIDWKSSVLILQQNGVGFSIYPQKLDNLMCETVFINVVEYEEYSYQLGNLDTTKVSFKKLSLIPHLARRNNANLVFCRTFWTSLTINLRKS